MRNLTSHLKDNDTNRNRMGDWASKRCCTNDCVTSRNDWIVLMQYMESLKSKLIRVEISSRNASLLTCRKPNAHSLTHDSSYRCSNFEDGNESEQKKETFVTCTIGLIEEIYLTFQMAREWWMWWLKRRTGKNRKIKCLSLLIVQLCFVSHFSLCRGDRKQEC